MRVCWAALMTAAIGLTGTTVPAQATTVVRQALPDDVNGDGRVDVIAGTHLLKAKGKSDAGGVVVYFGGPAEVSATTRIVTLAKPVTRENLGRTLATADFDRDGYADMLASARRKLALFRGSKTGLREARVIPWPVTAPAMAAADFDGDGDVAVTGNKQVAVLRGGERSLRLSALANGARSTTTR